ncbi:MAG: hypothetical protein FXF47_06270 [Candidatus Mcinerneyibacterium aminivorans]|uniref:Uncharacterized protein n=1 Tax=Candidatus Mcinerneyibacterium aminivorans TaxID=2703815 RepID=A0A5D0MGK9_9BACT|nr:MAG: hypothetical protein FXF47_06270 [Candidatus Mcinerneyibacterium aminivorans]
MIIIKKYLPYVLTVLVVSILLNIYLKIKISKSTRVEDFLVQNDIVYVLDSHGLNQYNFNNSQKKKLISLKEPYNKIIKTNKKLFLYSRPNNEIAEIAENRIKEKYNLKRYLKLNFINNEYYGVLKSQKKVDILNSDFTVKDTKKFENIPYCFFTKGGKIFYSIFKEKIIKDDENKVYIDFKNKDMGRNMTLDSIVVSNNKMLFAGVSENFKKARFYIYDLIKKKLYESNMQFIHPASIQIYRNKIFVLNKQNNELYTYDINKHKRIKSKNTSKIFKKHYSTNNFYILGFITYVLIILSAFYAIIYLARLHFWKRR